MRVISGLMAGLCLAMPVRAEGFLPWQDAEMVALGATVYADHCAACHGAQLEGQVPDWRSPGPDGRLPAPPHDETGHTWHHADMLLFQITKYGTEALIGGEYRSNMMGFGDLLSDAEIVAVLAYIKSTWPPQVIAAHDRVNAAAQ
ncbi:putative cytochrome c class I [Dinoroseobacter shibae DFL 12 = DSM 16493]|uniref:Putative cytochrome c class I n=3 Tax=Dinoroseobacter TaxID=309512 RepID=A8LLC8_DINSH|nr:cytochrome c [Dinoroseobacter shibae]ABV91938.1 putative cytochrome c class I [Dinoroseobacter shibae DFL 12 = DSM 16493]URF46912.1 cytochrome c [Dinoroseobacter shibae]URF51223.1 cytochrome c [Dinoroseobacter shibae]